MAAPKPIKIRPSSLMMPLTYNPYEYLKPAGAAYEGFLANMRFNMLASYYMQAEYTDSLESLISESDYILAKSLQSQLASDAFEYLAAAEFTTDVTVTENADEKGYYSLLPGLFIDLNTDTLTWQQTNQTQLLTINSEALRTDREGIQAKLLLELLEGKEYSEPINLLNEEITADELRFIQQNYPPSPVNSIQVYPHPVSNGSVVEINLESFQKDSRFVVTDMQGRYIMQFPIDQSKTYVRLDNTQLKPGTYIGFISGYSGERINRQIVVVE